MKELFKKAWQPKILALVALYEVIFGFLLFIIFTVFIQQITLLLKTVNPTGMKQAIYSASPVAISQAATAIEGLYGKFIGGLILIVITCVFIYTIFINIC